MVVILTGVRWNLSVVLIYISLMARDGEHFFKSNAKGLTIPDFKLYYRTIAMKTAWYCHKNRYEGQWERIEDPDMNPHSYAHLIFDKGAKNI
jgi:hypothetical protein